VIGESEGVEERRSDLQWNEDNEKRHGISERVIELRREVVTSRGIRIIIKKHVIGES
jgi:hypothetical protein